MNDALQAIAEGRHGDPFAVLGRHDGVVRTFQPGALSVEAVPAGGAPVMLRAVDERGVFEGEVPAGRYVLRITWLGGVQDGLVRAVDV